MFETIFHLYLCFFFLYFLHFPVIWVDESGETAFLSIESSTRRMTRAYLKLHIWRRNLSWVTVPSEIMNLFFRSPLFSSRPSVCRFRRLGRFCFNSRNQASMVRHQLHLPYIQHCTHTRISVREFRTSQPRFAGPLAVFLVKLAGPLSKVTKLAAIVGGR